MRIDRSRTMADAEYEKQTDASAGTPIRKGDYLPGSYRVETDAIRGGMGSVWRIYQTEYGVNMALKRPRQKYFTSPEQKLDFIRECDTWLNLGIHPNIVTCFRVAAIYGVPSIFSEWMDFSLKNAIADGTLYEGASKEQEKRLLDLAIQSAEGLCYAHAFRNEKDEPAGIIHQDVKPDNLLLTQDWQLKVADFGLSGAYAVLAAESVPSPASASGDTTILSPAGGYTIAYCSAEQMDHRPLSRRTDIYSWAVSMMEMYIGSRPWETGVVAGLRCGEYMKHTRVRMAPRLKELLARCMERDADKRPHDFEELIDALRDIYLEEFSENYFRARPEVIRGKSDSSRT
ncbi:MAG: serine/threonine-protein kinase, partial [Lachnospiraceae bacterium]